MISDIFIWKFHGDLCDFIIIDFELMIGGFASIASEF